MKTLYITEPGSIVRRQNNALLVEKRNKPSHCQPLGALRRIIIWGGVQVSTPALRMLLVAGIDVALLSASGRYQGALMPPISGGLVTRLAQVRRHNDADYALRFARRIVREKLESEGVLLRQARKHGALQVERTTIRRLDAHVKSIPSASSLDGLRGLEGAAARQYFEGFSQLVHPPWSFRGRNRRPPRDPVNALLSLGYVLLGNELRADLEARGFDPRLGFFHSLRAGRPALALDLLEPWRAPVIDRLVLNVLNRRAFSEADFRQQKAGEHTAVLLEPSSLTRYLKAYERHLGPHGSNGDRPSLRNRIASYIDGLEQWILDPADGPGPQPDTDQT